MEALLQEHGKSFLCLWAARNGRLDVLQWARAQGWFWNDWVLTNAAYHGYLPLLKWAQEHDGEWSEDTCSMAALNGQWDTLKWLHEQGCPWDADTCARAARGGHLSLSCSGQGKTIVLGRKILVNPPQGMDICMF